MILTCVFESFTLKKRNIWLLLMPVLLTFMVFVLARRQKSIFTFNYDRESSTLQDGYRVPNIVHFIWFKNSSQPMSFFNYMSIRSVHQVHKPEKIMLHCNNVPAGEWWERLSREVPLTIVHRQPPTEIFGQKITEVFHQGDIAKLDILLEYGGIYLDYDVFVVNNLNPLRRYPATYGKERGDKVIAGIIVAERNSAFIRLVYESYRGNYKHDSWDYNCAGVPYGLAKIHPNLVNIELKSLTTPDYLERDNLFELTIDFSHIYVIHAMIQSNDWHWTPEYIKTRQGTLGAALRWIYFGTKDMIFPNSTQSSSATPSTTTATTTISTTATTKESSITNK